MRHPRLGARRRLRGRSFSQGFSGAVNLVFRQPEKARCKMGCHGA